MSIRGWPLADQLLVVPRCRPRCPRGPAGRRGACATRPVGPEDRPVRRDGTTGPSRLLRRAAASSSASLSFIFAASCPCAAAGPPRRPAPRHPRLELVLVDGAAVVDQLTPGSSPGSAVCAAEATEARDRVRARRDRDDGQQEDDPEDLRADELAEPGARATRRRRPRPAPATVRRGHGAVRPSTVHARGRRARYGDHGGSHGLCWVRCCLPPVRVGGGFGLRRWGSGRDGLLDVEGEQQRPSSL